VAGLRGVISSVATRRVAATDVSASQADTEPAFDPALLTAFGAGLGDRLEAAEVVAFVAPLDDRKGCGAYRSPGATGAGLASGVHGRFDPCGQGIGSRHTGIFLATRRVRASKPMRTKER
jgi:hypothetical protein